MLDDDLILKRVLQYKHKWTQPMFAKSVGAFKGGVCTMPLGSDVCVHLHLDCNFIVRKVHLEAKEEDAWFLPRNGKV